MRNGDIITRQLMQMATEAQRESFPTTAGWPVFQKYEIAWEVSVRDRGLPTVSYVPVEGESHKAERPAVPNSMGVPELVVESPRKGGDFRRYDPLDAPGLFVTFARLLDEPHAWDLPDIERPISAISDEKVLEWVHQFGLPAARHAQLTLRSRYFFDDKPQPLSEYDCDSLSAIHHEIAIAQQLLSLYEACATRDYESLRARISTRLRSSEVLELLYGRGDHHVVDIDGRPVTGPPAEKPIEEWQERHYLHIAYDYLLSECSKRLAAVQPAAHKATLYDPSERLDLPFAAEVETGWHARTPLSAMYLQFWWLVTKNTPMRRCKYCGKMFFVTKDDQQYCPHPLGGGHQSLCRKKDYYRRRQKARRLYEAGHTAEEIAEQIDDSKLRTIQGWVKKWAQEKEVTDT